MRTVVFFDGQNLYHGARNAWAPKPHVSGSPYGYPSYDVEKLALALVARVPERTLTQIRFYTGVPSPRQGAEEAFWGTSRRGVSASIEVESIREARRRASTSAWRST